MTHEIQSQSDNADLNSASIGGAPDSIANHGLERMVDELIDRCDRDALKKMNELYDFTPAAPPSIHQLGSVALGNTAARRR